MAGEAAGSDPVAYRRLPATPPPAGDMSLEAFAENARPSRRSCRNVSSSPWGDGIIAGASVVGGSSPIASPGILAWQRRERFAQRPLRVIQQRSELVEQLMFPLPNGTHLGVRLLRALDPLALALHV